MSKSLSLYFKMDDKKTALIDLIKQTTHLDTKSATEISNSFSIKRLCKGEFLVKTNQISDDYLFLADGFLRTFLHDTGGNEITTNFYSKNSIVFEVTSFFQRVPSELNIQAITDCFCFRLSYEQSNELFHRKPGFRDFGRAILVKEFISSNQRTISMINQSAEQRYISFLKSNPEVFIHSPLKYIASYLGITDTSLSRIRRDFSKK
ncbi:Crp/Fnr family transcriptional regulator [Aquimarina sediminis]|uniref:Crp/Fnr family transcriptional regulator n=1 Tax=Aquimarina sediminis TaxID=2070536 RepID=UPI000CA0076F|nr:Crp/Fnr family transcriptional regulator [Aquimarina sediminis]